MNLNPTRNTIPTTTTNISNQNPNSPPPPKTNPTEALIPKWQSCGTLLNPQPWPLNEDKIPLRVSTSFIIGTLTRRVARTFAHAPTACGESGQSKLWYYEIIDYPDWWDFTRRPWKKIEKVVSATTEEEHSSPTVSTDVAHSRIVDKVYVHSALYIYEWYLDNWYECVWSYDQ